MKKFRDIINEKETVLIKPKRADDFKMTMDDNGNISIQFGGSMGSMRTADINEAIKEVEEFSARQLKNLAHETKHMQFVQKRIAKIKKEIGET